MKIQRHLAGGIPGNLNVCYAADVTKLERELAACRAAHDRSHAEVLRLAELLRKAGWKAAAPMHINTPPPDREAEGLAEEIERQMEGNHNPWLSLEEWRHIIALLRSRSPQQKGGG